MYLNRPAFPVSFSLEQTVEMISEMVRGKYWHDFEVGEVKLVYIPVWVFNYDAYTEAPPEQKGESEATKSQRVVSGVESGRMALNAYTNELSEDIGYLYDSMEAALVNEPTKEYPYEVQRPKVREAEAKRIIPVKMAARFSLPKENVIVSGLELVYLPMWAVWLTVAEGTFKLQINAVSGEILNQEEVPERERGWLELTSETLEELKQPGAWVEYTHEIGTGFVSWLAQNRFLQIVVLAIIAVLAALWTMGFI